jgi:hypothetical protein
MRVVLDTNVLMSGIFFAGPPARLLADCSPCAPLSPQKKKPLTITL